MKPFRSKAKEILNRVVNQRLFLIETGKSKNFVSWQQCMQVTSDIERLKSDKQFATYITDKQDLLLDMVAGNNTTNKIPVQQLIEQAKTLSVKAETQKPVQTKMKFPVNLKPLL